MKVMGLHQGEPAEVFEWFKVDMAVGIRCSWSWWWTGGLVALDNGSQQAHGRGSRLAYDFVRFLYRPH
jgi:hypothetical protein